MSSLGSNTPLRSRWFIVHGVYYDYKNSFVSNPNNNKFYLRKISEYVSRFPTLGVHDTQGDAMLFFLRWLGACLFCRVRVPTHLFKENVCLDPDPTESVGSAPLSQKNTDPSCCWGFLCYVLFHFVKKIHVYYVFICFFFLVCLQLNNKRIKIKSKKKKKKIGG